MFAPGAGAGDCAGLLSVVCGPACCGGAVGALSCGGGTLWAGALAEGAGVKGGLEGAPGCCASATAAGDKKAHRSDSAAARNLFLR